MMFAPENTYFELPEIFYARVSPTSVSEPKMVIFNFDLAKNLNLNADDLSSKPELFSGNEIIQGSSPIAQAYAGHQFGHFTMLGDGRAHLLGEILDHNGKRYDLQLKGSGRTPFSRNGDGRAALGPMLREYIISEAMYNLNIPTTRSLAVVTTGELIHREKVQPGAILTRVASSHLRVGTFEFALARGGVNAVKILASYAIHRHYPEVKSLENPFLEFLKSVIDKQARLVAAWMNVGFIHGVMNTDNMSIAGETIDYGPCAFMDNYDPRTVFSSIDRDGRYAYGNQPAITQWNLARLAETLIPLLNDDIEVAKSMAENVLDSYKEIFRKYYYQGLRSKIGLATADESDQHIFQELFALMALYHADYTSTFYSLSRKNEQNNEMFTSADFKKWDELWQARLKKENTSPEVAIERMNKINPVVIPRNEFVEKAIQAAVSDNDLNPLKELIQILKSPYDESEQNKKFRQATSEFSKSYKTFCGT